jgi:predicted peptidase
VRTFFIISFLLCSILGFSQQGEEYSKGEYISKATGDTLLYRYLTPKNPQKGKKYPVVIFLHGSGERGNNNQAQLFHGSGQFLNPVNRENYPAYVLFPQCPEGEFGVFNKPENPNESYSMQLNPTLSNMMQTLKEFIEYYASLPDADPKRIYIMGISMGGMSTFEMVARYPQMFAAAIPICGSVNPERLKQQKELVKKVKFRIYHGDADAAVPVEGSRQAYKALKEIGAKVEYIEFPGCTHNSWNPAFNRNDFLKWMFKQKK